MHSAAMKASYRLILSLSLGLFLQRGECAEGTSPGQSVPAEATGAARLVVMNFHQVALDKILDYLSDAAGLIIHKEADLRATVDVSNPTPVTCDQAVHLLNSALEKSGGAVVRDGRILRVVRLDSPKTSDLEVQTGSDPEAVGKSGEMVTQIIPVHYANAAQLLSNLQPLLPATATWSVNESANSLILVATKTQVRRMLRIVSAIDTSRARVSSIKIVPLRYADARLLATALQQLFSGQDANQNVGSAGPGDFAERFGSPGPGGPGDFANVENSATARSATKVTIVAEEQSNALVLSAPAEPMATLTRMVREMDKPVADVTEIRVFSLRNADPSELAGQLTELFPDAGNRSSEQNQAAVQFDNGSGGPGGGPAGLAGGPGGFGGGPPGEFLAGTENSGSNERSRKKSAVITVSDPRTSSLMVAAASTLMPQLARMIGELDASSARKEVVQVYDLRNADPQDISQVLQDLFNRSSATRNDNNNNRTSLLGQGNPLSTRETEQQTGSSSQTGTSSGRGGIGGAGGTGGGGGF